MTLAVDRITADLLPRPRRRCSSRSARSACSSARNTLVMFMCIELMLNAVNLTFVSFANELNDISGQVIVFFMLVVAAAEVVGRPRHHRRHLPPPPGRHRRRPRAAEGLTERTRCLDLVWLIPALPLAGVVLLLLFGKRIGEPLAGWLATADGRPARSSASVIVFFGLLDAPAERARTSSQTLFTWIQAGGFHVDFGLPRRPAVVTMVLFVTGVGALIHLYSIGYMHGDARFSRFFAYLNLFVVLDAHARARRQPPGHLPRLGGRRRLLVPPHLVLVRRSERRRRRRQEGVRHQPRRRLSASCSRCS